ncbi:MAG: ABC transporter ATP-binding protein [Limisphaerales bacterium]
MIAIAELEFQFPGSDFRMAIPSLNIAAGERVAIAGPSGSGKTTLLHLIAGILTPARGTVRVRDRALHTLGDAARRAFRVTHIGLVFQNFELVSYLDTFQNIVLPCRLNPALPLTAEREQRAQVLAKQTGIEHRLKYFPHQLSHGEKQRAAICRALLPKPALLLADEPTGNLDPSAKQRVVDLLFQQAQENGATLLMVTHDAEVAARFPRILNCRDFAVGDKR